jgi:phosphohistidine phosphatase
MKKITLVRHASAVGKSPDDFSRPLRKRGLKEARAMAEWYRSVEDIPDLLLSSPANRAIETAQIFAKTFGYPKKDIILVDKLYGGLDPSGFLETVRTLEDEFQNVMVFGHDPSFTDFARFIGRGFKRNLPKCSIFGVTIKRRSWSTIRRGDGHLDVFEHPEGLHQRQELAKTIRDEMTERIEDGILGALGEFGIGVEQEDRKRLHRVSAKLSKVFAARAVFDKPPPGAKQQPGKKKGGRNIP